MELDLVIPDDLDRDIWRGRADEIPAGFSHHGLRSHVLLAACRETEIAYERDRQGQFTSALLRTLKGWDTSLTYAQILERIRLDKYEAILVRCSRDTNLITPMQSKTSMHWNQPASYLI